MLWFPGSFLPSLQRKRRQIASWHRLWLELGRYLIKDNRIGSEIQKYSQEIQEIRPKYRQAGPRGDRSNINDL